MYHLVTTQVIDWNISDLLLKLAKKKKLSILLPYNQSEGLVTVCKHGTNIKV